MDPDTQLSLVEGVEYLTTPEAAKGKGTICQTDSDGKDAIAVDEDTNDD